MGFLQRIQRLDRSFSMPLIYVNGPADTFSSQARDVLAEELTMAALESIPAEYRDCSS
jgi:hypothetical protein